MNIRGGARGDRITQRHIERADRIVCLIESEAQLQALLDSFTVLTSENSLRQRRVLEVLLLARFHRKEKWGQPA